MKTILCVLFSLTSSVLAQPMNFVHPLKYDHSEAQQAQVVQYIKEESLRKYCNDDAACHPSVLELSEADNFAAFLILSAIQNKDYLNSLIDEYCHPESFQCTYADLLKIYEENLWCDVKLGVMRSAQNSEYKNRQYPNPIQVDTRANLIP